MSDEKNIRNAKVKIVVEHEVDISFDESKLNSDFIKEFEGYMWRCPKGAKDILLYLAKVAVGNGYCIGSDEFVEGIGNISDLGITVNHYSEEDEFYRSVEIIDG